MFYNLQSIILISIHCFEYWTFSSKMLSFHPCPSHIVFQKADLWLLSGSYYCAALAAGQTWEENKVGYLFLLLPHCQVGNNHVWVRMFYTTAPLLSVLLTEFLASPFTSVEGKLLPTASKLRMINQTLLVSLSPFQILLFFHSVFLDYSEWTIPFLSEP